MELEDRWRWEHVHGTLAQIQRYESMYWQKYGEPWRISVTWISNFDTTAGRAFLNRKE